MAAFDVLNQSTQIINNYCTRFSCNYLLYVCYKPFQLCYLHVLARPSITLDNNFFHMHMYEYIVNKPLPVAGISEGNEG